MLPVATLSGTTSSTLQPCQPVPHDVVHDEDQSGPAVSQSGNKSSGPLGAVL